MPDQMLTRQWSVLQSKQDGRPLVALVNSAYRAFSHKADFPWCLLISVPLTQPTPVGLATETESQGLERFQQQTIAPLLDANCSWHLVVRTTHAGVRDMLFYIDDPERVIPALNNLLTFGKARPFTFGALQDADWQTADRYLNPPPTTRSAWLPWRRRH